MYCTDVVVLSDLDAYLNQLPKKGLKLVQIVPIDNAHALVVAMKESKAHVVK